MGAGDSQTPSAELLEFPSGFAKKASPIVGNERNVILALRTVPELRGLVQYDEFALVVEVTRAAPWRQTELGDRWTDDDDTALMAYLQEKGIGVRGRNVVTESVALVAKDATVHPVRAG